jgi:hypothetical protein
MSSSFNPKPCVYNYNTQIYWNTSVNEYWEVHKEEAYLS